MTHLSLLDLLDARPVRPPTPMALPIPPLAPCPFCLSSAIFWAKTAGSQYVYCEGCGAEMHGVGPMACHYAALRWNTRGALLG